jgi:hypothetical protein
MMNAWYISIDEGKSVVGRKGMNELQDKKKSVTNGRKCMV